MIEFMLVAGAFAAGWPQTLRERVSGDRRYRAPPDVVVHGAGDTPLTVVRLWKYRLTFMRQRSLRIHFRDLVRGIHGRDPLWRPRVFKNLGRGLF